MIRGHVLLNKKFPSNAIVKRRVEQSLVQSFQQSQRLTVPNHVCAITRIVSVAAGASSWQYYSTTTSLATQCEAVAVERQLPSESELDAMVQKSLELKNSNSLKQKIKKALRLVRRIIKLLIALTPVAAMYPIQYLVNRGATKEDAQDLVLGVDDSYADVSPVGWYYRLCLYCVEWSGAAAIKLSQWAGGRPDLFGQQFCSVFSRLQDDTTPHAWKYTERALREALGDNWQERIRLDEVIGSGCIAQVYSGYVIGDDGKERKVAVKVMHPNVEADIEADLDLMRLGVKIMDRLPFQVFSDAKWLNFEGILEEVDTMLKMQLDLRTEAKNLVILGNNFKDNEYIVIPQLIEGYKPTKDVLVETFCEGVPILKFARSQKTNKELLSKMCHAAIEAVCQMLFLDNFVHGDLHPGNVLVSPDYKFILLDAGIVTEFSESDHVLISDVLAAFIRKEGRKAGRRMIDDSNEKLKHSGDQALQEELYIDKIEALTIKASGKDYFMEHLGTYISYICNAAATHHVKMNPAFVSAALAVKVQEGIALALDPDIEIWRIACPIILEGERRRGQVGKRASEMLGLASLYGWLTGEKESN